MRPVPKRVALDVFKTDILPSSGEFLPSEIREDSSAIRARYFNVLTMAGGQEPVPASTQSHTRLLLGQPDLFSLSNGVCLCGVCLCSNCVWIKV